jgi:hypothetical protein
MNRSTGGLKDGPKSAASLKKLSDIEKLQLIQLQKTREKIMQELQRYPGGDLNGGDDFMYRLDDGYQTMPNLATRTGSAFGDSRGFSATGTARKGFGGTRPSPPHQRHPQQQHQQHLGASGRVGEFLQARTGIDMVPVMATSGHFAMGGGGMAGSNGGKNMIKLPIFKLPAIESSKMKAIEQNRQLELAISRGTPTGGSRAGTAGGGGGSRAASASGGGGGGDRHISSSNTNSNSNSNGNNNNNSGEPRFIAYGDLHGYRKALVLMIKSLRPRDAQCIQAQLRMTAGDIADLEAELMKRNEAYSSAQLSRSRTPKSAHSHQRGGALRSPAGSQKSPKHPHSLGGSFGAGSSSGKTRSSFRFDPSETGLLLVPSSLDEAAFREEHILDSLFREDPYLTVFGLAKEVVVMQVREKEQTLDVEQKEAQMYNKALRNMTAKMDMSSLGLSDEMLQFLTAGASASSKGSHFASTSVSATAAASAVHPGTTEFAHLKTNVTTALQGFASAGATHAAAATAAQTNQVQKSTFSAPGAGDDASSRAVRKISSMPSVYGLEGSTQQERDIRNAYGKKIKVPGSNNNSNNGSSHDKKRARATSRLLDPLSAPSTSSSVMLSRTDGFIKNMGRQQQLQDRNISASASSSDLQLALMSSLRVMQKHSNMVRTLVNLCYFLCFSFLWSIACPSSVQ